MSELYYLGTEPVDGLGRVAAATQRRQCVQSRIVPIAIFMRAQLSLSYYFVACDVMIKLNALTCKCPP